MGPKADLVRVRVGGRVRAREKWVRRVGVRVRVRVRVRARVRQPRGSPAVASGATA